MAARPDTLGEDFNAWRHPQVLEVHRDGVSDFGTWRKERRPYLQTLEAGARVGLAVRGGKLHLHLGGQNQGQATSQARPQLPRPCYLIVGLGWRLKKVTGQNVRPLP